MLPLTLQRLSPLNKAWSRGPRSYQSPLLLQKSKQKPQPLLPPTPRPLGPPAASTRKRSARNPSTAAATSHHPKEEAVFLLQPRIDPSDVPPPLSQSEKTLLGLRQQFRKLHSQLARVQSHLEFCNECHTHNMTLKDLRVNVSYQAMLRDYLNVAVRFDQTSRRAEHDYSNHLSSHYRET